MKTAIIGAGPSGLYTAIQLWKRGVRDLVVYDPRADNYNRPGHLHPDVFAKAQNGLGLNFWPEDKIGHIYDLENELYEEAIKLGIKIENKPFIGLHQDDKKPGVIVENKGQTEVVEADYVFDCTGSKRAVITAVNQLVPESPLKLTTFADLPVRTHFLAYVKIKKQDWEQFELDYLQFDDQLADFDPLNYVQSMMILRALGWKEIKFPRCYGMEFGNDEVCIYMHAPKNLSQENYDNWVQAVLESYTKSLNYTRFYQSTAPLFIPFTSNAQVLTKVSYEGENLPSVIGLGDAQIDSEYLLSHGIEGGMERIDALLDHLTIFDNEIHYFDAAEYQQSIDKLLSEHQKAISEEAERVKQSFVDILEPALLKFKQALLISNNSDEQAAIKAGIKEIEARQTYIKALKIFAECHNKSNQVVLTATNVNSVSEKLKQIQNYLLKAHTRLPKFLVNEHKQVLERLIHLAVSWKEVGDAWYKYRNVPEAIAAYKQALEIYNLKDFVGKHSETVQCIQKIINELNHRLPSVVDGDNVAKMHFSTNIEQQAGHTTILGESNTDLFSKAKNNNRITFFNKPHSYEDIAEPGFVRFHYE